MITCFYSLVIRRALRWARDPGRGSGNAFTVSQADAERAAKRKKAPAAVGQALAKTVATKQDTTAKKIPAERAAVLDKIVKELAKQAGIKIDVHETVRQSWAKQSAWLPVEDVPLETVLDLIAVSAGADWEIVTEGRVKFEERTKE